MQDRTSGSDAVLRMFTESRTEESDRTKHVGFDQLSKIRNQIEPFRKRFSDMLAQQDTHQRENTPESSEQHYLPARMLNEFIYCPRLFYYEHVESIYMDNADTIKGATLHKRVDSGSGEMPSPNSEDLKEKSPIHSRSVTLGSERLKVIAKMDLIESRPVLEPGQQPDLFDKVDVIPVDYKAGIPKDEGDINQIWDTDKMQLGVQILVLRENGYRCKEGIIYYWGTRQRVRKVFDREWEEWIYENIKKARICSQGKIPPPLDNSPKCVRCSLAPVCLPDETNNLIVVEEKTEKSDNIGTIRRIQVPRDDKRALYLNTQGAYVGRSSQVIQMKIKGKVIEEARIGSINHIALFGNIQLSTQAIQSLCYANIPITYFSIGGFFYGLTRGLHQKNVFLRIQQFRKIANERQCLLMARQFVSGKIHNQRTLLRRNHVEAPPDTLERLKHFSKSALRADNLDTLLGIEGSAAALYFKHYSGMIKIREFPDSDSEDLKIMSKFNFNHRNRRPPKDPVNALLSLSYSILAKDCAIAAHAVGLDPYIGFYHQPRYGRAALALDLMEEFRPLIADSTVLLAINNGVVTPKDFISVADSVNLNQNGRKKFFHVYEQRINHLMTHPVFKYKLSYRRVIELQFRILARVIEDQIPEYIPIKNR